MNDKAIFNHLNKDNNIVLVINLKTKEGRKNFEVKPDGNGWSGNWTGKPSKAFTRVMVYNQINKNKIVVWFAQRGDKNNGIEELPNSGIYRIHLSNMQGPYETSQSLAVILGKSPFGVTYNYYQNAKYLEQVKRLISDAPIYDRTKTLAYINQRRGQVNFRKILLRRFKSECLIEGVLNFV